MTNTVYGILLVVLLAESLSDPIKTSYNSVTNLLNNITRVGIL